jgi:hypothetical protein
MHDHRPVSYFVSRLADAPLGFSFVDWSAPVSTLVGAIVGVGATMLADRSRWKREQGRERIHLRRESYGSYLAAIIQAHEAMRAAAAGDDSPDSKRAAITEAFRVSDPYVQRFELSLVAPADVVEDAVAVFRRTREIRDLLISGAGAETAQYRAAQRAYYDAIKAMADTMRKDLGNSPLGAATMGGPLAETGEEVTPTGRAP